MSWSVRAFVFGRRLAAEGVAAPVLRDGWFWAESTLLEQMAAE
jgi:hypothetical protein